MTVVQPQSVLCNRDKGHGYHLWTHQCRSATEERQHHHTVCSSRRRRRPDCIQRPHCSDSVLGLTEKKHAQSVTPSCTAGKTVRARAWCEFPLTRCALRPRCPCSIVDGSFLLGDLRTVLVMLQIPLSWICCGWPRLLISSHALGESKLKETPPSVLRTIKHRPLGEKVLLTQQSKALVCQRGGCRRGAGPRGLDRSCCCVLLDHMHGWSLCSLLPALCVQGMLRGVN